VAIFSSTPCASKQRKLLAKCQNKTLLKNTHYNPSLTEDMRQPFGLIQGIDVENHKTELDCLRKGNRKLTEFLHTWSKRTEITRYNSRRITCMCCCS